MGAKVTGHYRDKPRTKQVTIRIRVPESCDSVTVIPCKEMNTLKKSIQTFRVKERR